MAKDNKKNDWFPQGYEVPVSVGNYMKLEEGENKLRILSSAIVGWEYWEDTKDGRRPIRAPKLEDLPKNIQSISEGKDRPKHFWAFVVYNRGYNRIQILEVTQKQIMNGIENFVKGEWGNPKEYDLVITRKKTGSEARDVDYSVNTSVAGKKALEKEIADEYAQMNIDLQKLYSGENPFGEKEVTMADFGE